MLCRREGVRGASWDSDPMGRQVVQRVDAAGRAAVEGMTLPLCPCHDLCSVQLTFLEPGGGVSERRGGPVRTCIGAELLADVCQRVEQRGAAGVHERRPAEQDVVAFAGPPDVRCGQLDGEGQA